MGNPGGPFPGYGPGPAPGVPAGSTINNPIITNPTFNPALTTAILGDRDAAFTAFTPTLSLQTMGDVVFTNNLSGYVRRLGFLVYFQLHGSFVATYTTANGQFMIGGWPYSPQNIILGQFCMFYVTPALAAPTDRLIGSFNNGNLLGMVTGYGTVNNFWGAANPTSSYNTLATGVTYTLHAGGVYSTAA